VFGSIFADHFLRQDAHHSSLASAGLPVSGLLMQLTRFRHLPKSRAKAGSTAPRNMYDRMVAGIATASVL